MGCARLIRLLLLTITVFFYFASVATGEVAIDWVTLGDPGNDCDPFSLDLCYGTVSGEYRIGKFEVSNEQYTEFLNAVAVLDQNALYSFSMGSGRGGIARSGSPGSRSYSPRPGFEDLPVNFVSFWDATRFANWLHNSQPTGAQDNTTTEDGAYTLTETGITNNTVTRNAGANFFIPNAEEWYKAAYYDTGAVLYYDYPAGSDTQTVCAVPSSTSNRANCGILGGAVGGATEVGSYTGSASPSGTFDQGGNAWEWVEDASPDFSFRKKAGGSYTTDVAFLSSDANGGGGLDAFPTLHSSSTGMRIASTVAAPVPALGPLGIAILLGALGATAYWMLRKSGSVS